MFTLRFERHSNGYEVYGCQRYSVGSADDSEGGGYRQVRMYRTLDDDNPYFEQVGDKEPFSTAYVTNAAGKTVDTIR